MKNKHSYKIGYDAKRIFHNTTGLGNYSRDLVRVLADFYPDNEYVLYNPKPKKVHRLELSSNMREVLPDSKFWKKFSSIWRQKAISKQITDDKIDIYHGLSGELPAALPSKVKKVVTIHDLIFVRYPELYSFFDRKIHFKKFANACKVADKIIAISEQTKKDVVEFLKVDPNKIEVIYQGCHHIFKEKQSEQTKELLIKKYNLPKEFILNVGTIEARKNALSIVEAIKNVDVSLVIVGRKTKYYQQMQAFIDENSMQHKVFFLEGLTLQELSTLYQLAMFTVYPSVFEGFGIPIIESLYSKTPVITTKGGVFPEAGGPNSIYVNTSNVDELSNAIKELLISEEKRKIIADKGFGFVQKFNDELIAKNMMSVYEKM